MGLFGSIMKGMGFKNDDEVPTTQVKDQKPDDKYNSFDKGLANSFVVNEFKASDVNNAPQFPGLNAGFGNLIIYAPKNNNDIKVLVDCLRRKEACIVDLSQLKSGEADKILQFLSGAVYALKGSIKRLQGDLFLMAPEGINIMQGKK